MQEKKRILAIDKHATGACTKADYGRKKAP